MLVWVDRIERVIRLVGITAAVLLLPSLAAVRITEILTRNILNAPTSLFNAIERELFILLIFLIVGWAYSDGAHVRVDIFRPAMSPRRRAWIELTAILALLLPLAAIVVIHGGHLALSAWDHGERAAIFLGAPARWVIVGSLPFGIALLALAGICRAIRTVLFLRAVGPDPEATL